MPETIFYRGPSGTTIDISALEAVLVNNDLWLNLYWDSEVGRLDYYWRVGERHTPRAVIADDASCRAEIVKCFHDQQLTVLDSEEFPASDQVEGMARLLRRVLPEPAKVLGHVAED